MVMMKAYLMRMKRESLIKHFLKYKFKIFGGQTKCSASFKSYHSGHKLMLAQLEISRNKFDALMTGIQNKVDILLTLETKLDETFPTR